MSRCGEGAMARQGLCHCGMVLKFRRGPWGYKKRCPRCGAVVRLRLHTAQGSRPHLDLRLKQPAEAPLDVELVSEPAPVPTPERVYWLWVALAAALAILGIVTLIWFTW